MTPEETDDLFRQQLVAIQLELRSFIRNLVPGHSGDVEDIAQNTMLALLRHEGEYDPARPFRTWAFSFARLQVMSFQQRYTRSRVIFNEEMAAEVGARMVAQTPDEQAADVPGLLRKLVACEKRLSPLHRDLLTKRYRANRSVRELAQERRSSPHSVTVELAYIRKKLGECIRSLCRLDGSGPELTDAEKSIAPYVDRDDGLDSRDAAAFRSALNEPAGLDFWLGQNRVEELLRLEAHDSAPERGETAKPARYRAWLKIAAALILAAGLAAYGARLAEAHFLAASGRSPEVKNATLLEPEKEVPVEHAVTEAEPVQTTFADTTVCTLSTTDSGASPGATRQGATEMSASKVTAALAVLTTVTALPVVATVFEAADTPSRFIDTRNEPCTVDTDGHDTWVLDTNPPTGTLFTIMGN